MRRIARALVVVGCMSSVLGLFPGGALRAAEDENYYSLGGMVLGPLSWKVDSLSPFLGIIGAIYHPMSGSADGPVFGIGGHGFIAAGQATVEFADIPGVDVEEKSNLDVLFGASLDALLMFRLGEKPEGEGGEKEKPSFIYLGAGAGGAAEIGSVELEVEVMGEEETFKEEWTGGTILLDGFVGLKWRSVDFRLELQAFPGSDNVTVGGIFAISYAF
jgi:hypothetical protein